MDKTELSFEASAHSLLFRIPDEIVVRLRSYTFDDGYVGTRVDVRARGHVANDHGVNLKRVRQFLENIM